MFGREVSMLLALVAAVSTACKEPGDTVSVPTTPGTFSLVVEHGTTGKGPKTPYSGLASFNTGGGHFQITCWTDSTFSTPMVNLTREQSVTGPGSFDVVNPTTAANNPASAATFFVVTDAFTSPTATPFGGSLTLTGLTATTATAQFGYSDGTYSVDGAALALTR